MAERQETSVMASIQDILRDAQLREEQDKVAAQRKVEAEEQARLDGIRQQQQNEERRIREEEEERQRRAHEEQRKAAEISAIQEATVQRARMEAEAQARLAEMSARQDHERQLNAIKQDKSKKVLTWLAIGIGVVLIAAVGGGGYALKVSHDKEVQATQAIADLQDKIAKQQQDQSRIQAELNNTKDPQKIAQLQAELKQSQDKVDQMNTEATLKGKAAGVSGGGAYRGNTGAAQGGGAPAGGAKPPCSCAAGDPLCSCL